MTTIIIDYNPIQSIDTIIGHRISTTAGNKFSDSIAVNNSRVTAGPISSFRFIYNEEIIKSFPKKSGHSAINGKIDRI
jgi:hypothetical protein